LTGLEPSDPLLHGFAAVASGSCWQEEWTVSYGPAGVIRWVPDPVRPWFHKRFQESQDFKCPTELWVRGPSIGIRRVGWKRRDRALADSRRLRQPEAPSGEQRGAVGYPVFTCLGCERRQLDKAFLAHRSRGATDTSAVAVCWRRGKEGEPTTGSSPPCGSLGAALGRLRGGGASRRSRSSGKEWAPNSPIARADGGVLGREASRERDRVALAGCGRCSSGSASESVLAVKPSPHVVGPALGGVGRDAPRAVRGSRGHGAEDGSGALQKRARRLVSVMVDG